MKLIIVFENLICLSLSLSLSTRKEWFCWRI